MPVAEARVVIVEGHALFAEALALALALERYDVHRVPSGDGPATTSHLLLATARLHPDIVLLDLDLDLGWPGEGTRLVVPLCRLGARVVVVTASTDRALWGECLLGGARRVLPKTRPLVEVLATVRRLWQGLPVTSTQERGELIRAFHEKRGEQQQLRRRLELLTVRESQVLAHLMDGHPVREIAQLSVVSEATVRTQVKSILAKLDVSSQLTAVGLAHRAGWSPPP